MRISDWSSDVCSSDLTQLARATTTATASAPLEQPTTPKQPALKAEACDDAARKAAAATDGKPARSWAKRMQRRTTTSYRLTLEFSGGEAVRLERTVRPCLDVYACSTRAVT